MSSLSRSAYEALQARLVALLDMVALQLPATTVCLADEMISANALGAALGVVSAMLVESKAVVSPAVIARVVELVHDMKLEPIVATRLLVLVPGNEPLSAELLEALAALRARHQAPPAVPEGQAMETRLWIYRCHQDGAEFRAAAGVVQEQTLLLRSTGLGTPRVLGRGDRVYDEVCALAAETSGITPSDYQGLERLWRLLSALSDPDVDGSHFAIDAPPPCPACHGTRVELVQSTEPAEFGVETLAPLSWTHWQSLTREAQVALIRRVAAAN